MTLALTKGHPVVTAGLAAITGAGVELGFTVLDSIGLHEHLASHPCHGNPASSVVPLRCRLVVARAKACLVLPGRRTGEPLHRDGHLWEPLSRFPPRRVRLRPHPDLWRSGILGILCGLDSEAVPPPVTRTQVTREPPCHCVVGGCLLLDSPKCALHRHTAWFIASTTRPVLVRQPGADWIDRGRCGVCDHLERP